jgi:branched-chain amino acid transport system permease protein
MNLRAVTPDRSIGVLALALAAAAPLLFSTYWVAQLLTQMLILGIAAASLIFLSAYAGMVSLAQLTVYGIAGFLLGNLTTNGNTKGLNEGWDVWLGVVVALALAVAIALVFGALASRNVGIYFLMITLIFSVIVNLFFGQVTDLSGFGGISGIPAPKLIGNVDAHPNRLYYLALVLSLVVYAGLRYIVRSPFWLTLQGIRDDPVRMSSLGYNVPLHRTVAFGFAGLVAGVGGVLFVWWNGHIDPATIDLGSTVNLLVIAVIGGLYRIEGAWVGALVFVLLNNYSQRIGFWSLDARFQSLIGAIFLVIVLVSPKGLIGAWERLLGPFSGSTPDRVDPIELPAEPSV